MNFVFIVLLLIYIECKPISGRDNPIIAKSPYNAVPSPYQGRTILAPCLHQPCTKYARQSGGLCSEDVGFTYHQPAESGAVVPALERTNSEGGAKKERTKCEYSPVFTCEKIQKMPEADMLHV
ncbi:MAG: hypothetical protein WAP46_05525 [Dysgonamonadaceae bacterium]